MFVDINTIDDQLQLNKLTTAIEACRPFYVHIRVPCGDQQVNLHDAWFAELTSTLARQVNSMQLFVTIELEPGTKQWLLKPYKELIGNSTIDLTIISQKECLLGDVVTDAFRSFPWSDIG